MTLFLAKEKLMEKENEQYYNLVLTEDEKPIMNEILHLVSKTNELKTVKDLYQLAVRSYFKSEEGQMVWFYLLEEHPQDYIPMNIIPDEYLEQFGLERLNQDDSSLHSHQLVSMPYKSVMMGPFYEDDEPINIDDDPLPF